MTLLGIEQRAVLGLRQRDRIAEQHREALAVHGVVQRSGLADSLDQASAHGRGRRKHDRIEALPANAITTLMASLKTLDTPFELNIDPFREELAQKLVSTGVGVSIVRVESGVSRSHAEGGVSPEGLLDAHKVSAIELAKHGVLQGHASRSDRRGAGIEPIRSQLNAAKAPPDAVLGFENDDGRAPMSEASGRRKTCDSGADDADPQHASGPHGMQPGANRTELLRVHAAKPAMARL
jgi:hypothetical protein